MSSPSIQVAAHVPDLASQTESRDRRYRLRQSALDLLLLFLVLILASALYGALRPDQFAFNSAANIRIALEAIPMLGIVALGVGVLMIAGEFDLSVGANFIFTSVVMAQLHEQYGVSPFVGAPLAVAMGIGIGLLNGAITLRFRIPSFITTLGTMGIWSAATLFFHGASSQSFKPSPLFRSIASGRTGILSAEFGWLLVLALATYLLLQRHSLGNHLFAAGGDPAAATATGVRVARAKLLAFAIAGGAAAFSGVLTAARIGNIAPSSGAELPLQAIAACVIGGLMLTGGRGTVLGIVLGAALIYWIQDVLLLLGAPGFYLTAFVGALTIGAAVFYEAIRARRS